METKEILEGKIDNLKKGIELRDTQIAELKEKLKEVEKSLRESKSVKEEYTKVAGVHKDYEKKIEEMKQQHETRFKGVDDYIRNILKEHESTLARYEALLKILQGTVDSHIELHNLSAITLNNNFK